MALFFALFSVFLFGNCFAQKENNIWYFGKHCGVNFNTTPPSVLTNSKMEAFEGCASVCDKSGSLLFYTNGINVWNKLHDTMPNGYALKGPWSSTQAAVIVKRPGNNMQYYIFNADEVSTKQGIYYSIVDMTLNSGLGDVVQKNIHLVKEWATEKLAVVPDATGCNFWVVCHSAISDTFYSFHITSMGLDTNAMASATGYGYGPGAIGVPFLGYMKASPDGTRLAVATWGAGLLEIYDFDGATGKVSNARWVDSSNTRAYYGISFSPNSKLLYACNYGTGVISQFDLSLSGLSAIRASRTEINSTYCIAGALQLGPDGKIYVSKGCNASYFYLGAIQQPDVTGTGCNYIDTAIYISSTSSFSPTLGLPETVLFADVESIVNLGRDTTVCNQGVVLQPVNTIEGVYSWNTGDTSHSLTTDKSGVYWLKIETPNCGSTIDTIKVTVITDTIKIDLGPDTIICGSSVFLTVPIVPQATYLWSNGLKGRNINVTQNGQYWVQVKATCGNRADTVNITLVKDTVPKMNLGPDTTLCAYSYSLRADSAKGAKYLWSTGDTGTAITAHNPGLYWVKAYNDCQVKTDSVLVSLYSDSVKGLSFGNDTLLCSGSLLLRGKVIAGNKYLWGTGDTVPNLSVTGPGTYWLYQKAHCDEARDTINIRYFVDGTTLNLGKDTIVCGPSYNLNSTSIAGNHYLWNTGDTVPSIIASSSGQYWLKVTNICNTYNDTVNVSIINDKIPNIDFGPDTILCAKDFKLSVPTTPNAHYTWSTGDTAIQNLTITKNGTYWLKAYNYCETKGDTIKIELVQDSITSISMGNDTLVCDTELELDAGFVPKAKYYWSTKDTVQKITVNKTGSYAVEVSTYICNTKLRDTIRIDFFEPKPLILQDDTTICEQVFNNLTIKSPLYYSSYNWNTGDTKPEITVQNEGTYILTVKDICENNFTDTVNLQLCDCKLYIPNAFTPNKNGLNDRFTITSSSCPLTKFHLKIFNRWGQLIFETDNPETGWDGTYLGESVPMDAYIYSLSYRYAYMHTTPDFTGIVNVIR